MADSKVDDAGLRRATFTSGKERKVDLGEERLEDRGERRQGMDRGGTVE